MSKQYPDDLVDITEIKRGETLRDWFEDGVRIVVLRGGFSMNVYLGVPSDHPLAGFGYDSMPIDCHGRLTFASEGDGEYLPKGFYWYGYDYAHAGDYAWYHSGTPDFMDDDKKWSLGEIVKDTWESIYSIKQLMKLAEAIDKRKHTKVRAKTAPKRKLASAPKTKDGE